MKLQWVSPCRTWSTSYDRAVRNRIELTDSAQHVVHRVVLAAERFDLPALPPVVGGRWGDVVLDGFWGPLRTEGPALFWDAEARFGTDTKVDQIDRLHNESASLVLADGRRIEADFGSGSGQGVFRSEGEFHLWHTEGGVPVVRWVGRLRGAGFLRSNLVITSSDTSRSMNMRLQGRHTWYLLTTDRETDELTIVIDGANLAPAPFNRDALRIDFDALQIALGCPLQLDTLTGLDEAGNIVGAAGVHLGGNRATKPHRRADGPVPDEVVDECWIPLFFESLSRAMTTRPDLPWGTACTAYLDSVSDATIDGRYLKLQVALEVFARALQETASDNRRLLVVSRETWTRWVKKHGEELKAMVADPKQESVFVNKVISAMNLPSSGVVAEALAHLTPPLAVDPLLLDEIGKRNVPAHHFRMNKPGVEYHVERDVERVDMLRSLLAALIARASGYDGALAGWVTRDASHWKPQPGWWPAPSSSTLLRARTIFESRRGPIRGLRRKTFLSRIAQKLTRK